MNNQLIELIKQLDLADLIELIKQLDLADLDALISVLNSRRYRLKELKEKQFAGLVTGLATIA